MLRWSKRDLTAQRYVYFSVDGIHVQARLEDAAQCLLVIVGATPEGKKEFVGLADGVRESTQSWKEMLLDLRRRGLTISPELAFDGSGIEEDYGGVDRCLEVLCEPSVSIDPAKNRSTTHRHGRTVKTDRYSRKCRPITAVLRMISPGS